MVTRARLVDVLFGVVATLFGAVSLFYPFGRDQGLFYYAAREWLLRGQVLYRDVWDHKPPVIYLVHMATIAVFGEHPWGIRVVELTVAVPLLAWLTARLSCDRGTPVRSGALGAAWVGVAVFYYGYLGFWDTAQCEIWSAVFGVAALVAALHVPSAVAGALAAGVLSALAIFTKPPSVFFVIVCAVAVLSRARNGPGARGRSVARSLGAWALGGAGMGSVILGYFWARGALAPMLDILVGANAVYVAQEPTARGWGMTFLFLLGSFGTEQPFSTVFVVGVAAAVFVGVSLGDRALVRRYLLPAALLAATVGSVLIQRKFYAYHWGPAAAAAGLFAATLLADMERVAALGERNRGLAPAAFLGLTASLYVSSGGPCQTWLTSARRTAELVTGQISREEFSRNFDLPLFYSNHDAELTGRWLRAHAGRDDTLVVRGFEPEIYATSGLHFTGRFFWTAFLTLPTRAYRREQWLREDLGALLSHPPRWAVTPRGSTAGIDSTAWFQQLGYRRRADVGGFTVLERPPLR